MAHVKMPTETRRNMCGRKRRYKNRGAAEKAKESCSRKYGHSMRVYPCPI